MEPLFLVSLSIIEYFAFNYTIGNALTYGIKLSIPCLVLGRNKVVRSMSPKWIIFEIKPKSFVSYYCILLLNFYFILLFLFFLWQLYRQVIKISRCGIQALWNWRAMSGTTFSISHDLFIFYFFYLFFELMKKMKCLTIH